MVFSGHSRVQKAEVKSLEMGAHPPFKGRLGIATMDQMLMRCFREVTFARVVARGDEVGCGFALVRVTPGPLPPPRPAVVQPTSIPDLVDHSQTSPKTRVLVRAFKMGKRSGYRAGGWMTNSKR